MSRGLSDRARIYVDASFGPGGFSGIGGLCIDSSGEIVGFFSKEVPKKFLDLIQDGDKDTAILELEAVAVPVEIHMWKALTAVRQSDRSNQD